MKRPLMFVLGMRAALAPMTASLSVGVLNHLAVRNGVLAEIAP